MKKIKISQSLIKDLEKYFVGERCGHLIYKKYTSEVYTQPTDAMKLGSYFEYEATGALPKDGITPEPEYLKDGTTLAAKYKIAHSQAQLFKSFCKELGIKIIKTQQQSDRNGLDGTSDILAEWNKKEVIIDLKYSGFINNEWEEMGWNDIYNANKRGKQYAYHSTQSLQYSYIFERPFYFWVFSSINEGENILIEMVHSEEEIEAHVERAAQTATRWNTLVFHERNGLAALPEYNVCKDCVLFSKCKYRAELPVPKKVCLNI